MHIVTRTPQYDYCNTFFINRRVDCRWVVGSLSLQHRYTIMQMPVLQIQLYLKDLHYADKVLQNEWGLLDF